LTPATTAAFGYACLLLLLLGGYRVEAGRYRPQRPVELDLAARDSELCVAVVGLGRPREGLDLCRRSLRVAPDSAPAQLALAIAYVHQGLVFEAMAADREAIRRDPDFAAAHAHLGALLAELGRLEEAAAELRRGAAHPGAREWLADVEGRLAARESRRGRRGGEPPRLPPAR